MTTDYCGETEKFTTAGTLIGKLINVYHAGGNHTSRLQNNLSEGEITH